MKIGYIRCSTVTQNTERQYEGMKNLGIERYFEEKVSAKDLNRPKLNEMLDFIREGDEVYVWDLSRISRSNKDLINLIEVFEKKKAKLICIKENLVLGDNTDAMSKFITTVMIALYEMERENTLERTREGVELAKQAGKYHGRPESKYDIEQLIKYKMQLAGGGTTKTYVAKKLGISRPTLDKRLRLLEELEVV